MHRQLNSVSTDPGGRAPHRAAPETNESFSKGETYVQEPRIVRTRLRFLGLLAAASATAMLSTGTAQGVATIDNLVPIPYAGGYCQKGSLFAPRTIDSGQCHQDNASVSVWRDSKDPYNHRVHLVQRPHQWIPV